MEDAALMKTYVGVKTIKAEPCSYFSFLEKYRSKAYRDTVQPKGGDREGYLVEYPPDGYVSWSPKDVFEEAYFAVTEEKAVALKKAFVSILSHVE